MNIFEVKAKNKDQLNKSFHTFYKNLVTEVDYHLSSVKSIKPAKYKNAKTYDQVVDFVDKRYTNNKNKLAFDKYIEDARKEILSLTDIAPKEKFEKIDEVLDGKINVYSDDFQANLRKTLKSQIEEKDVFLQLVYNLTMGKIEQDYLKLNLPQEKYKLKIKDETNKKIKDKTKSV